MNLQQVRNLFPYLRTGRIYFNHASTGPMSLKVKNILDKILTERSESDIDNFRDFIKTSEETRAQIARLLNTTSERIGFNDNTSTGINLLAQGIKWQKGDRILLNDLEFPSNVYPFMNLEKQGVLIDFVKSHNGIVSADDIINSIKPGTRLISVSVVQFLTGYRINLEKLGKVCKEKGIILSVDAIQGLGAIQLDVVKCNIDFLASGTQKWLLGLQGMGFYYISKKLQEELEAKYVGWLSVNNAWNLLEYDLSVRASADGLQTGTLNTLGIYALNASLNLFEEFGNDNAEERVLNNSSYFISELQKLGVKPILANCTRENLAGIITFKHDKSQEIFESLVKKNINCAVRVGMVRFSPHFYNTKEEIDTVVSNLSEFGL